MDKRLLSCCLMLVLLCVYTSSSEGASVKKPVKVKEPESGGVWSAVAELATRVVRQLADDFSGEDSAEDDEVEETAEAVALKEQQAEEATAVTDVEPEAVAEAAAADAEADSEEDDDDDDDIDADDFFGRRVQRSVDEKKEHREQETPAAAAAAEIETEPVKGVDSSSESSTPASTTNFSVLILIRNALKRVTTELPAEQVATNALHYFQLFEHFLQQTIEQVIDDVDDDKDEESTVANELANTAQAVIEPNIENHNIVKPPEIISENLPSKTDAALTEEKPANEVDNVLAAEATTVSA